VLNHDWLPERRYDMGNSWVGKIIDIRGNSPRNIWLIVQWYFSGKDIAQRVKSTKTSIDTSLYGKYERSLSQDRQVISILSINGKATVVNYDETSPLQEPIPADVFYSRRAFNSLFGSVMPAVEEGITCICGCPYKPDDDMATMHFCPRFGCRRWYHAGCLNENDYISKKLPEGTREFLDIPPARIQRVPPDLLRLASSPIIRGGKHGVVGNVKAVCEAREWAELYARTPWSEDRPGLLMNDITLDRWIDGLDGVEVEELIYPDDESGSENLSVQKKRQNEEASPPYVCPTCGKPV